MTLEVSSGRGQGGGSMGHTEAGDREGRVAPAHGTGAVRVPGDMVSPALLSQLL